MIAEEHKKRIEKYTDLLLDYSKLVNIVSKKISREQLNLLINESIQLDQYVSSQLVIDAGSGSGILGIPIAILHPEKQIVLVEPRKKKSEFLIHAKKDLNAVNVIVANSDIESFLKSGGRRDASMISRGFPHNEILVSYLIKRSIAELILITSLSKIKKIEKRIEKCEQNIYNVAFRDHLKIIHVRNVSRET